MNEWVNGEMSEWNSEWMRGCVKKHQGCESVRWGVFSLHAFQIRVSRNINLKRVGISCVIYCYVPGTGPAHSRPAHIFVRWRNLDAKSQTWPVSSPMGCCLRCTIVWGLGPSSLFWNLWSQSRSVCGCLSYLFFWFWEFSSLYRGFQICFSCFAGEVGEKLGL